MSSGLLVVPSEVLANITSFFSDWEDVLRLSLCGNSLLTTKLKAGGVKIALLRRIGSRSDRIEPLTDYNLDTLTIRGFWFYSPTNSFYSGSVRNFEARPTSLDALITTNELYSEMPPTGASSCAFLPWTVSLTFPNLQSLHLVGQLGWKETLGAQFWNLFMRGLPRSLTSLSLPGVPLADWDALPPHLTSIEGVYAIYPICDTLKDSLIDISLILDSWPYPTDDDAKRVDICSRNVLNLVYPPNLTSLSLQVGDSETLFPRLPSTLTYFHLHSNKHHVTANPYFAIASAAPSLQHLRIEGFAFKETTNTIPDFFLPTAMGFGFSDTTHAMPAMPAMPDLFLPGVKKLELMLRFFSELDLICLLKAMPNLEVLIDNSNCQIKLDTLLLLNPSNITTLRLCLTEKLLENRGVYPLCKFTNLTDLDAHIPDEDTVFSFKCFPSSITKLSLRGIPITTKMLHSAPANIKTLTAEVTVSPNPQITQSLFMGSSSTLFSTLSSSSILEEPKGKVLCCSKQASFKVPINNGSEMRQLTLRSIKWHSLEALPPNLTALMIPESAFKKSFADMNSDSLPFNLVHLELEKNCPRSMDLGRFNKLLTLKIEGFEAGCTSRCPPNLTRLFISDSDIRPSFLPLPTSITSFTFRRRLSDLAYIDALPNLQEFGSLSQDHPVAEFAKKTRPSIKSLIIDRLHLAESFMDLIPSSFPSLETLTIEGAASYRLLHKVSSAYSHRLKIRGGTVCYNLDGLFLSPELRPGSLFCTDQGDLRLPGVAYAVRRTIPNWKFSAVDNSGLFFDDDSWSAFTKLIPPQTAVLDLVGSLDRLSSDWPLLLPKQVTQLRINWPRESVSPAPLPDTIKRLSANITGNSEHCMASLPPSLTDLSLRIFSEPLSRLHAQALPGTLTSLRLYGAVNNAVFGALPNNLILLHLEVHILSDSDLAALPVNVRFFQGYISPSCASILLSDSYTGKVTWIAPPRHIGRARHLLATDPNIDPKDFVQGIKSDY